jgi:hypothetical protein
MALLAQTPVPKTGNDVKVSATIDLGDNTKELLNQGGSAVVQAVTDLAKSLKMTVDQIFPYYVRQAYLNGLAPFVVFTISEIILLAITLILALLHNKYSRSEVKGHKDAKEVCGVFAIIIFVVFLIVLIIGALSVSGWIKLMMNPEYGAIRQLIDDAKGLLITASDKVQQATTPCGR